MKAWNELTHLEQLACIWWDVYKDAYNMRPRGIDTSDWTVEQFEREIAELSDMADRENKQSMAEERAEFENVKARITQLQEMHGFDWAQAVNHIDQEMGTNGDIGFLEFQLGIPYGSLTLENVQ
jgi:tetrahydromethanopterin S-methyltransferase subunit G